MPCSQIMLKSILNDCERSIGGLKVVYAINYDSVTSVKVTDGQIVGITLKNTDKFKKFEFRKGTSSMTSTLNIDVTNGNSVSTDVTMSFLKQETTKRLAVSALALSEIAMIVVDANGTHWYLGRELPVTASAGTGETGTQFSDGNRYSITLQDVSSDFPYEVKVTGDSTSDDEYVKMSEIVED